MDTGCGYDLVARHIAMRFGNLLRRAPTPMPFSIANGVTTADEQLWMRIKAFADDNHDAKACAYVMGSTPAVLSVGRRCQEHGYHFLWVGYKTACIITNHGVFILLRVISCIPYLDRGYYQQTKQLTPDQIFAATGVRQDRDGYHVFIP